MAKKIMSFMINGKPCSVYRCHTWFIALYTKKYSDKACTKIFQTEAEAVQYLENLKDKETAISFWWQKEEA